MTLLPEGRERTPFGKGEPVSQVPEECWLLSNCQKSSSISGGSHLMIFQLPLGVWGIGISLDQKQFGRNHFDQSIS